MNTNETKQQTVVVGIDIGTDSAKVVLGSSLSCEIVRNEVGGDKTPSAVSFLEGKTRQIGQSAGGKNAITHLTRLLSGEVDVEDKFHEFYQFDFDGANDRLIKNVQYSTSSFAPASVLAMLLGKIRSNVEMTIKQKFSDIDVSGYLYALSIGGPNDSVSTEAKEEWLDAAYAAGIENCYLVDSSECYKRCYQRKFPESFGKNDNEEKKKSAILVVDMGNAQTTVTVVGTTAVADVSSSENPLKEEKIGDEKEEEKNEDKKEVKVLSSLRHKSLGAGSVDVRLWEHFQSTIPLLKNVKKSSKAGHRLLASTKKLKHLLSQLSDAVVTVENVAEDRDVKLAETRQVLVELCQPDSNELISLINKTIDSAEIQKSDIFAVEVLGGGCRIPWVKEAILTSVKIGEDSSLALSYSLDDTCIALGAALIGEDEIINSSSVVAKLGTEQNEKRKNLRELEQAMSASDEEEQIRVDTMNKIEAHILEMRSASQSGNKHSELLPKPEFDSYLNEAEEWLFSDEAYDANKDIVTKKFEEIKEKINNLAKDYKAAIQKEKEEKDRQMEEEAKLAQIQEKAENGGAEEDDHDNRRLPKKRRMEIVMKNKAEANELFSDGNYKFAAARYTKALSHCCKFVDLSPDDTNEVNGVKLSLNLNLALAYTKLEKPDQALRVCDDALKIDDNSTKALYRRASIYSAKNMLAQANADIKKAVTLLPDDKAIQKLQDRINIQVKRQKQKEKKMAQKMFK